MSVTRSEARGSVPWSIPGGNVFAVISTMPPTGVVTDLCSSSRIVKPSYALRIRTVGLLCRLKLRREPLIDSDEARIESILSSLVSNIPPKTPIEKTDTIVVEKQDTTYQQSLVLCEDIESAVDDYVRTKTTKFDTSAYLKSNECSAQIAAHIATYYSAMLKELVESDGEGYRFTKPQFKKYIQFVQTIVDACAQRKVSAKVRKPRSKKPVSPTKIVSKLKYCKEDKSLKLKSVKPESIVGCSELWAYNVKYRKLIVYKSEKNSKLSVKGTTILGYDIQESKQVMLRKPEQFFADTQLAKRALANGLANLSTKPITPSGRINDETILLATY